MGNLGPVRTSQVLYHWAISQHSFCCFRHGFTKLHRLAWDLLCSPVRSWTYNPPTSAFSVAVITGLSISLSLTFYRVVEIHLRDSDSARVRRTGATLLQQAVYTLNQVHKGVEREWQLLAAWPWWLTSKNMLPVPMTSCSDSLEVWVFKEDILSPDATTVIPPEGTLQHTLSYAGLLTNRERLCRWLHDRSIALHGSKKSRPGIQEFF